MFAHTKLKNPALAGFFFGTLVARTANATGAGPPDMTGLFAIFIAIVSIAPLLLLEWAIARAKNGQTGWYFALPAIVLFYLLVGSMIAAMYQGLFLNIDGIVLTVLLAWTAHRTFVFFRLRRTTAAPSGDE